MCKVLYLSKHLRNDFLNFYREDVEQIDDNTYKFKSFYKEDEDLILYSFFDRKEVNDLYLGRRYNSIIVKIKE